MKKISRLAALAAATALLFGAIGCSDEDEAPTPADTVSPASFELTSSAEAVAKEFTLTLGTTQINETGLAALKANTDLTTQKADIVTQSEGNNINVSAIKVAEDATATMVKLSLTMASSAAAGTKGTLTLTLPADFTANGKAIAKTISYEIKGSSSTTPPEEGGPENPSASATAKSYNLVGLALSDFPEGTVTAKDNGAALSAFVSGADNYIKTQTEVSVKGATLYGGKNNLRIRATNGASTALNYNGGESADISSGTTISGLSRYVKIPVDGAGTITVEYAGVSSDKGSKTCQIALLDETGGYLGGETVNTLKDDAGVTQQHTFDITVTKATSVYIVFSRNGASGGGIDLYKIEVKPAAAN